MVQKVCLIVNFNLYESKRHFTLKLAEAMDRKGIITKIVDTREGENMTPEVIASIYQFAPDITCSFSSFTPTEEGLYLWDFLKIPHVAFLVDPVLYNINLIKSPYSIISCVDRFDCEQLRQHQFQKTFFWPHAIERELAPDPKAKKIYDVVFLGSCHDYESLQDSYRQRCSEPVGKALDRAAEIVLGDNKTPLTDALVLAWNEMKLDVSEQDFCALFYYFDNYTRGKDRVDLIRSVTDAEVHVFGELVVDDPMSVLGWKEYLGAQPNVVLHPSVPYEEAMEILKKSKICLNSTPFFKNGSHERIFASLACGAVPITTDNLFVREFFKDGEDLILYQHRNLSEVNGKVNELLANENKRQAIAAKGRAKVMAEHTWDTRVDQLVEELAKLGP